MHTSTVFIENVLCFTLPAYHIHTCMSYVYTCIMSSLVPPVVNIYHRGSSV